MYVPAHFAMTDDQVRELLRTCEMGELVTHGEDGLHATPLPWLYDEQAGPLGTLVAHVARTNHQWQHVNPQVGSGAVARSSEAMVMLRGPDHYVSPGWLPSKAEHGRVVPTWDYLTVHAYGPLVAVDDPDRVRDAVTRLTARHETGRPEPWTPDEAPAPWLEGQLRAIVRIEVPITRWVAKAKMSQNKTPADVEAEIAALRGSGRQEAAAYKQAVSLPAAQRRAQVLADVGRRRRPGD
ncbi:FMN-binding negative transcriptional regulator [Arsenicicoccus bolidensis]|uniref:FMN-binding negative transcriptional regulator n=1 Tax=Arsenicicoccus bolidensis TaxID=229480 RepID=UPI00040EDBE5|nr:FMN-binding negative transcriptional regulator [Arsenicicoccus bolidensis]